MAGLVKARGTARSGRRIPYGFAWPYSFVWTVAVMVAAFVLVLPLPLHAELGDLVVEVEGGVVEGSVSQGRIDGLEEVRDELFRDYRVVIARLEDLREYNESLRVLISDQERETVSLKAQIEGVTTVEREITPLMFRMLESLELFVKLDKPFLARERGERVGRLQRLMASANVSVAEKFRKLIEAYQIESEYGRTIEAYRSRLGEGGDARTVDFLKVGRVAFYYQTLDREETGIWDAGADDGSGDGLGAWRVIEGVSGEVRLAINMAREVVPPDLLVLPLGGPEVAAVRAAQSASERVPGRVPDAADRDVAALAGAAAGVSADVAVDVAAGVLVGEARR